MALFSWILDWLRSLFFRRVQDSAAQRPSARAKPALITEPLRVIGRARREEMELSLIGLNAAGKTSLVNVIATGHFSEDMIPTVGFNMRKVTKGNVSIKARAQLLRRLRSDGVGRALCGTLGFACDS